MASPALSEAQRLIEKSGDTPLTQTLLLLSIAESLETIANKLGNVDTHLHNIHDTLENGLAGLQ